MVALQAAGHQELGVGHGGRGGTLQLAVGFRQRPEAILQAAQPLVCS